MNFNTRARAKTGKRRKILDTVSLFFLIVCLHLSFRIYVLFCFCAFFLTLGSWTMGLTHAKYTLPQSSIPIPLVLCVTKITIRLRISNRKRISGFGTICLIQFLIFREVVIRYCLSSKHQKAEPEAKIDDNLKRSTLGPWRHRAKDKGKESNRDYKTWRYCCFTMSHGETQFS